MAKHTQQLPKLEQDKPTTAPEEPTPPEPTPPDASAIIERAAGADTGAADVKVEDKAPEIPVMPSHSDEPLTLSTETVTLRNTGRAFWGRWVGEPPLARVRIQCEGGATVKVPKSHVELITSLGPFKEVSE